MAEQPETSRLSGRAFPARSASGQPSPITAGIRRLCHPRQNTTLEHIWGGWSSTVLRLWVGVSGCGVIFEITPKLVICGTHSGHGQDCSEGPRAMRRSFLTAVLVAPLVVPVICTGTFALYIWPGMGLKALPAILIVAGVLFFSTYGATIVIGAPILLLASRWMRVNALVVLAAGALAAAIAYLPLAWLDYQTSGNNSGPPDPISPLQFLHWAFAGAAVPFFACIFAGLITATAFYFLSGLRRKHGKTSRLYGD